MRKGYKASQKSLKGWIRLSAMAVALLLAAGLMTGCLAANGSETGQVEDQSDDLAAEESAASTSQEAEADLLEGMESTKALFEADDFDFDWKGESYRTIKLNGSSIAATGTGISVKGSTVTISASGIYEVTGSLTNGSVVVDIDKAKDKGTVFLVLNGAQVSSDAGAPINIEGAKKVVLLLAQGSKNAVTQGSKVAVNEEGEPTSAVLCKADLTITGKGSLTVTTEFNDGITSRDDLRITSGNITVDAFSDAIVGKDSVSVAGGTLTIKAGKDGIRSTNDTDEGKGNITIDGGSFTIVAAYDGMQAFSDLTINGGDFDVSSGGGYPGKSTSSGSEAFGKGPSQQFRPAQTTMSVDEESKKGLKAGGSIEINGGNLDVSSYDDTINSNGAIAINGGALNLESGDDAIHADKTLSISSGEVTIKHSYEGLEAAQVTIKGGKTSLVATDDGININLGSGMLAISGGFLSVNADGDGIDSNGGISMTGGTVYVDGPTGNMNGSLDYMSGFTMTGGIIVASGSSGMAQAPSSNSTQPSILMYYSAAQAAGVSISLKDVNGNAIISFTPTKAYSSVAISSPDLKVGSSYTLYSGGEKVTSITIASVVTYVSETGVLTGTTGGGKFTQPGGFTSKPPR